MWACSSPFLRLFLNEFRSPNSQDWTIISGARISCNAAQECLSYLYCYQCGEGFLGGFADPPDQRSGCQWYLNAGPSAVPARERSNWYFAGGTASICGIGLEGSVPDQWTHAPPGGGRAYRSSS